LKLGAVIGAAKIAGDRRLNVAEPARRSRSAVDELEQA
jgi:hypothetical protein